MAVAPDKTQLTFTLEDGGGVTMRFACKSGWVTSMAVPSAELLAVSGEGGMTIGRLLLIELEAGFVQHVMGGYREDQRMPGCGCEDAMAMLGIVASLAKAAPQTERA